MELNQYHVDAGEFFQEASKKITKSISGFQIVQQTLNVCLGLERLLKGILYDVNPTYILVDPSFKNSAWLFYKEHFIVSPQNSKEVSDNPNGDVLTFKNSLVRAQFFSENTRKNRNLLFKLSEARDIIVHNQLNYLDLNDLKLLLQRDYYPLVSAFSLELDIKSEYYFGDNNARLSALAGALQDSLGEKVRLLLEGHLHTWHAIRDNVFQLTRKEDATRHILQHTGREAYPCPACSNTAILHLRAVHDVVGIDSEDELVGYELRRIKCQYCNLDVKDAAVLDYLQIKAPEVKRPATCARCSRILTSDDVTGLCEFCEEYYGTEN